MEIKKRIAGVLLAAAVAATLFMVAACDTHTHEAEHWKETAAICTEDGNVECWKCASCGKYFADEDCTEELSEADVVIAASGHDLQHNTVGEGESLENGASEYWQCSSCGKVFSDQAGQNLVTLRLKMFTDQTFYSAETANGPDVFTSTEIGGKIEPIADQQFVLRFFMGFNHDLKDLTNGKNVEVHMNVHRKGANPNWWQFVLEYYPSSSRSYALIKTDGNQKELSSELVQVMEEQNGLYFLFVRNGSGLTVYAENAEGTPVSLYASQTFSTGAVYQMRIAHFENFFADATHGGVIKDMSIALDTIDLYAERTQYAVISAA